MEKNNWKKTKLSNTLYLVKNLNTNNKSTTKYFGLEHLDQGGFTYNGYGDSQNLLSGKFCFQKGDILLGKLRPYFRKIIIAPFEGICSTDIWVIRTKPEFDKKYMFYFLANQPFIDYISKSSSGTKMPRADWNFVKQSEWTIPPLNQQKSTAKILSSLDDKIELLREENKILESIAQLLFKRWFVDFEFPNEEGKPYKSSGGKMIESDIGLIPNLWKTGKLVDFDAKVTDFVANGSFASLKENVTLYNEKNFALFLRNTDLKSNFKEKTYVDEHSYNFLKKTQLHGGEIIISNVGDVGSVYLCPYLDLPMVLGNNTISLSSKFQSYFYTLFTNKIGKKMIESITGGSAQPKFNKTDFRNLQLLRPSDRILIRFEVAMWQLYNKILKNTQDSIMLTEVRDYLLPKLMSGEISL